jgi:hypothetical protein
MKIKDLLDFITIIYTFLIREKPTPVPRCGNFRGWSATILFLLRIFIGISVKLTKIRFNLSVGKLKQNHSLEFQKTTVRANKKGLFLTFS